MRNKLLRAFVIVLGINIPLGHALPEDRDQPIRVSADSATINDKTGITTYKGNVVITQGSLLIEAEHVELYRNDGGVEKLIAKGKPSHFRQQSRKDSPYSDAWGLNMLYMLDDEELTITREAKVIQGEDTFTGEKIVYDLSRSIVNAFGNAEGESESATGSGRVNMIIQPKSKKEQ